MHLSWFSTAMWISLGNTSRSVITHTRGRPLALVAWEEAACQTFSPFLCFPETFHALASGQTVGTTEVWYSDTGQPRHPSPTQSPPASCNPTDLLIHPSPLPGPPIQANDNVSTFLTKQKKEGTTFQSCSDESVTAVGKWKLLCVSFMRIGWKWQKWAVSEQIRRCYWWSLKILMER